ncbi:MAG: hypothetical protein AB4290_17565, partial [Spirulina sp.]
MIDYPILQQLKTMPRFNPKNPKRDKVSEVQDTFEGIRDDSNSKKLKRFNVFTNLWRKQHKNLDVLPEIILEKLEENWHPEIEPTLIEKFGRDSTLYVIFYHKNKSNIIMEIWDPNYVNQKPSQVFSLEGIPEYITKIVPQN